MDILYEDARILVCIKPAGVVSAGDDEGSMIDLLRKELSDAHACVRSVHRLDAQVSGLMVFARSQAAASILSEQVRTREFEKEYLAAAHGRFKESAGQMEDLLWYNRSLRKSRVMQETGKDVKRALLSYEVLAYCEDRDVSLVRIRLHTGRTHQIRVHLSSMGCPILGDYLYGNELPELKDRRPEVRRGRTGRLPDCALVLQALVSAPAKRAADRIFRSAARGFSLESVQPV